MSRYTKVPPLERFPTGAELPQVLGRVYKGLAQAVNALSDGFFYNTKSITASYTATVGDMTILADATAGAVTVTLPAASDTLGKRYFVKKTDASVNTVTVQSSSGNIDGAATKVLSAQYASAELLSDGAAYQLEVASGAVGPTGPAGATGATGATGADGAAGAAGAAGPGYTATSTTSLTIGTGSTVFTTQAGLAYTVGARARASSAATPTNYMEGLVTAYTGTSLTINVDRTSGSGTAADWNINIAGDVGATGAAGATGATGATGTAGSAGATGAAGIAPSPGGRLTLCSGDPYYNPTNTVAVSGQDTTADTITVTAHGWSVGTMVVSSATSGGITAATTYYAGNITTNTISLHTTLAAAIAGTGKLNITGAVTANITAFGVANQTIYYTPAVHNQITLWDGAAWTNYTFSELSLALGTVTTSIGYDVFAYVSGGAATLEMLAWTNATARATGVSLQDGRWCKTGDKTRLLLGSYYSRDTTSTESSLRNRFLQNIYNQIDLNGESNEQTSIWAYTTATWRAANNSLANNSVYVFNSLDYPIISADAKSTSSNSSGVIGSRIGINVDSTSATPAIASNGSGSINEGVAHHAKLIAKPGIGLHYIVQVEYSNAVGTCTWNGIGYTRLSTISKG